MDVHQIIADVARARADLIELASDTSVTPERLAKCEKAENDLETSAALILTAPWIPRDVPTLAANLHAVNKNLKVVQDDIAAKIHYVLKHGRPDEFFRMGIAFCGAELLAYQRDVLMTTWANLLRCPCGCGTFVTKGWVN